jgi:hypothetical protein
MTTLPKWNDERTAQLVASVGSESPVTKATVDRLATELETSARSISSKLRKLDIEVVKASETPKAFSDDEAAELREFVEANADQFTYGDIAAQFANGKFTAKAIQGKILSMELTDSVKATPKAETTKTYSDADEATVTSMVNDGAFVEDIAAAVGRSVASVRGKALSLLRADQIKEMPKQRDVKGQAPDSFEAITNIGDLTVAEIAEKTGKTERGVKTILTRRGINVKDHKGADKAAKKAAE